MKHQRPIKAGIKDINIVTQEMYESIWHQIPRYNISILLVHVLPGRFSQCIVNLQYALVTGKIGLLDERAPPIVSTWCSGMVFWPGIQALVSTFFHRLHHNNTSCPTHNTLCLFWFSLSESP
jgi:hypothetical protein